MSTELTGEEKLAKQLHWFEWIYYVSQVTLAVLGIWALFIYSGQLKTMRDSVKEMRGSSAQTDQLLTQNKSQIAQLTIQAEGTQKLAEQARLQAEATKAAINIGKRQADITETAARDTEADKRPWVTVTPEDLPELPDTSETKRYAFALYLKNYGDTPARNVRIACEVFPAGSAIDTRLQNYVQNNLHPSKKPPAGIPLPTLNDFVMQAPLAPSQREEVTVPWPSDHFPLNASYLAKVRDSHAAYYVQCKLLYDGSYGVHGETDCLWFVGDQFGPWALISAEIGNDIH